MTLLSEYGAAALLELLDDIQADQQLDPAEKAAQIALIEREVYTIDPVLWGKLKLGEHWWSKQREIAESVRDNRRTAVQSSHGVGKSFTAARIACWWLDTHPPGEAFVATSAPTASQVRAVLWREINKAHRKGNLIGRVNQTEWLIGNELIGFGRKPANPAEGGDDETVTAFQGIHARYVLVVLDEACGIPEALWVAADSLITGADCHIMAIGNPDDPTSHFERVCREDSNWNTIQISSYDSPNFTDEEIPDEIARMLPSAEWVEEAAKEYGVGTAVYTAKVLGQFPKDASDAVIPYSYIGPCKYLQMGFHPDDRPTIGVDVGAGGDETVITAYQAGKYMVMPKRQGYINDKNQWRSRHDDPMLCVSEILDAIKATNAWRVNIDAIGVGWAVAGSVEEKAKSMGWKVQVNAVQVSEQSEEPEKYANIRAELWWGARMAFQGRIRDVEHLDDQTINELTFPKWKEQNGKIVIEKNEDIVKRLGRSPDNASSALLAAYEPKRLPVVKTTKARDTRRRRPR